MLFDLSCRGVAAVMAFSVFASGLGACASEPRAPAESASEPAPAATPTCEPTPAAEETMRVANDIGTLEGTLLVPEACGPVTVVLVIPGSGATDRNGGPPATYRLLAEALAAKGIASLRYDKALIGASAAAGPSMKDFLFERGADDAVRLVEALRADARFDRVVVLGHSEGSLLGMLVADRAKRPLDGFVSLAGAGRPIGIVLREQLAKNIADAALLARANDIIAALERGETVDDVPKALRGLFDPSMQPYLVSWMKIDPAREIATAPAARVLVVQGTTDVQIGVVDAERLAAARPDAKLVVVEGMNHVLKAAAGDRAVDQEDAYVNPKLPIVAALVEELTAFVVAGR